MARSEFLTANHINTTTQVIVQSNTVTSEYLFDRNVNFGYSTNGYNSNTSTLISIEFSVPQVISHILLQSHNLQGFRLFYNSTTANSLYVTTTNSATGSYISFNSITVSSVQLQMDTVIGGSAEKTVGELVIAERLVQFERNPSVKKFNHSIFRKQIEHEMPDGGSVLFNIKDKYRATLSWEFITMDFRDDLFTAYSLASPFYFVPFPTTTVWDNGAYEVVWPGLFNFRHATNDKTQGFSGDISLKETPAR